MKDIKLAINYLESFIECDSVISHWCSDCGKMTKNEVEIDEVMEAIKVLKGAVKNDTKQTS